MKVNGVFEGGGVKGISLAGAVLAAETSGVSFHQVAGTSAGSVVAALIAAGYSAEEMKNVIDAQPFTSFLRRAPIFNIGIIGPAVRLFLRKGLYSGDAFESWVRTLLAAKGIKTFGDLPAGKLRIIASDITNGKLLVLPDDIKSYGIEPMELEIAHAIRMSASIPYFFDPVILRGSSGKKESLRSRMRRAGFGSYIVDGGLLSNFPLWLFDEDGPTGRRSPIPVVGFQMVGRQAPGHHRITGPFSMFYAMFETMLSAHDERYIEKQNRVRTIKIPTLGVRTTDFKLSTEKSDLLFLSGLEAGLDFFRKWDRNTGTVPPDLPPSPKGPGPKVNFYH